MKFAINRSDFKEICIEPFYDKPLQKWNICRDSTNKRVNIYKHVYFFLAKRTLSVCNYPQLYTLSPGKITKKIFLENSDYYTVRYKISMSTDTL